MKAAPSLFILLLALPLLFPAQVDYKSPLASVETFFNGSGLPSLSSIQSMLGMGNSSDVKKAAGALANAGSNPAAVAGIAGAIGSGNLSGIAGAAGGIASAAGIALPKPPTITIPLSQLRIIAAIAIVLFYVFAAGKIADFLQSTGRKITKKEALFAPFALMFVSAAFVAIYFLSGAYRPPQDTLITNIVYLVLIPAGIALFIGSFVLYGFFHDRLNFVQSLDLSIHIVLSPIFDGIKGYWTALGAAVILGLMSTVVFYSTGGRLALATFDFLLLSIVISLYYLYRMITAPGNENKASSAVTILCLLAPSIMQRYLKDAVCAILMQLPFGFFQTCPLDSVGSEVTLMVSIGATMLLLIPVVPILYAFTVNLIGAFTLAKLLLAPGPKPLTPGPKPNGEEEQEGAKDEEAYPPAYGDYAKDKGASAYPGGKGAESIDSGESGDGGEKGENGDAKDKGMGDADSGESEDERESEEIAKKYRGSRPKIEYHEPPEAKQPKTGPPKPSKAGKSTGRKKG